MNDTFSCNVTFEDTHPAGRSFYVIVEGQRYIIPNFAVHDNSEIWKGSEQGESGELVLRQDIAEAKGLCEPAPQERKVGLLLKKHRLPPLPSMFTDEQLECFGNPRLALSRPRVGDDCALYAVDGKLVAMFESPKDAQACSVMAIDVDALVRHVHELQDWIRRVDKQMGKGRKR